jgi:ATP-dependent DNA helicase RecQ
MRFYGLTIWLLNRLELSQRLNYILSKCQTENCLDDIAKAGLLTMALLKEMEQIVYSGTKLNIKYWIDEMLDDEQQEEIHDYFMESESDIKFEEGDYDIDELVTIDAY